MLAITGREIAMRRTAMSVSGGVGTWMMGIGGCLVIFSAEGCSTAGGKEVREPVTVEYLTVVPPATQPAGPAFQMSAQRANDPALEPLAWLQQVDRELKPAYAFDASSRAQWQRWHDGFRQELARVIGLQFIRRSPLRVTPGPVDELDGYTRHAFTIETSPGLFAPAFLLVPQGLTGRRAAILCSHGHGLGMNDLVALDAEGKPREEGKEYQHDFALQAVRAGFVTLAFDQFAFGRRRDIDFNKKNNLWNACEQPSKNAIHFGLCTTGVRVYEAMRMIDFLQSRPEVDPERIGMVGISGGGLVTQFTAALDDRVKAACVSGFCNRFEACILSIHHCIDNYVPGLGRLGNSDDVACLVAPRPLLIEAGTKDPIFPIDATRAALSKLERCYQLLGVPDRLEADIFDRAHEFSGAKTWTFFKAHLRSGTPPTGLSAAGG
jgi:dienelactone hydrolase